MESLRGRLVTPSFIREVLPTLEGAAPMPTPVRRRLYTSAQRCERALGPASSLRAVADACVVPLLELLGLEIRRRQEGPAETWMEVTSGAPRRISVLLIPWGQPMHRVWQHAIR